jgi:hypothetical protein
MLAQQHCTQDAATASCRAGELADSPIVGRREADNQRELIDRRIPNGQVDEGMNDDGSL